MARLDLALSRSLPARSTTVGLILLLSGKVTQLDRESEGQLGELLHMVEIDMGDFVVRSVDPGADVREIALDRECRPVSVLAPRSVVRA